MSIEVVAALAATIADHAQEILVGSNTKEKSLLFDPESCISDERIFEVAKYVCRDLARIEKDQDGRVAVSKISAYIGFWFAKLKPINSVFVVHTDGSQGENELCEINEALLLLLMDRIFWDLVCSDDELYPTIWNDCTNTDCKIDFNGKSVKGLCFFKKHSQFMKAKRYRQYLTYGLRYRAVSPYFLVNYIDEGLFFSCECQCPPIPSSDENKVPA